MPTSLTTSSPAPDPAAAPATRATVPQPGHVFAAPAAAAAPSPGGVAGLGQITLSLCIVLAAIFAFAWVARRMRGLGIAGRSLDIVADVRLGPKERAVVLQVGAQQLLLGVAPGRVATLHVLPEPLPAEPPRAAGRGPAPGFAELLRRSLGK